MGIESKIGTVLSLGHPTLLSSNPMTRGLPIFIHQCSTHDIKQQTKL